MNLQNFRQTARELGGLLKQRLNLALLGLAVIACYPARDYMVFAVCLVVETCYLSFSIKNGPFALAVRSLPTRLPTLFRQVEWQAVLSWFLLTFGILFVFVVRAQRVLINGNSIEAVYERWEIAALAWNIIFALLSYLNMPIFVRSWSQKIVPILWIGGLLLTKQAFAELANGQHVWHFLYVLLIAILYLVINFITGRECPSTRQRSSETLLYADIPTAGALLIILGLSVAIIRGEQAKIFLSGVIAFQFTMSSLLLVFIESKAYTVISACLGSLDSAQASVDAGKAAAKR